MSNMSLFFNYKGKSLMIQCQKDETLDQVFNRYCTKSGLTRNDIKFYLNAKELMNVSSSLKSNGIEDKNQIDVVVAKYVIGA